MGSPLLATKLFLPPVRPDRVERQRLLQRLDEVLRPGVRLGLISAPAGFGKTSLLSEWIACRELPAVWLALDAGDNAPGVFLAYLTAAVERARPNLLVETAALQKSALSGAEPVPQAVLLATLVNELSVLQPANPLVILLDDYQFITAPEVREAVAFLVENLPPGVRLVIATRADPPLPLARLRARRQMLELRAADLRFTPEEAASFLIEVMGLPLNQDESHDLVTALTARTEGWIAGLQMAALALQAQPEQDAAGFVQSFTGSHRFILDYLAEEVLARLPEETTHFLLQTALLERFNAELCSEVIRAMPVDGKSQPEAEISSTDCAQRLEQLDRANLFLIPLDGQRSWFRYHHLFSDLLQARLKQVWPEQIPHLHRRASAWFEKNGLIAEAIQHALAAGQASQSGEDYEQAAQLVEKHTLALFMRGELHALMGWVNLLPEERTAHRPWFCVYRAWVLVFSGQLDPIEGLLRQAEAGVEGMQDAERRLIEGNCAAIRTQRAIVTNNIAEVFQASQVADEKLPEESWARGVAGWAVAYALRMQGNLEQSAAIYEQFLHAERIKSDPWGMAMMRTDLGLVRKGQGRIREARAVFETGLTTLEALGARKLGYVGRLLTAYAGVLYDLNDLESARRVLEEAIDLNQRWRNPNHLVFASLHMTRVLSAQKDFSGAQALLEKAEETVRKLPVVATLGSSLQGARTMLLLAQNQPPAIQGALESQIQAELAAAAGPQPYQEVRELRLMLLIRMLLAHARPAEALRLLEALETAARSVERHGSLIEILALKALACYALSQHDLALQAMQEAVTIAEPEGSMRAILDAAPLQSGALPALLDAVRRKAPAFQRAYLDQLFSALIDDDPQTAGPIAHQQEPTPLIEPLSERELEVLGLLAEGLTNAQIAERLYISVGTVKAHTANIFRKLDAANRTQAVAKAREWGYV